MNVTAKFILIPGEQERWWHEFNCRERVGTQYASVYQTDFQRVCGLIKLIADVVDQHGPSSRLGPTDRHALQRAGTDRSRPRRPMQ